VSKGLFSDVLVVPHGVSIRALTGGGGYGFREQLGVFAHEYWGFKSLDEMRAFREELRREAQRRCELTCREGGAHDWLDASNLTDMQQGWRATRVCRICNAVEKIKG
jgi:hypothetical protein